jgi:hypothetical protein
MCWQFDILNSQIRRYGFYNYKMVKISISKSVLCISQVGLSCMLCMCFLGDLDEFHSRNKRSAWKDEKMEQNWKFEVSIMKPSSRRLKWYMKDIIWSSDEEVIEVWRCSRQQNRKFRNLKPKGLVFTEQVNMSRDFHRVWLWLSDSWK